ncbi:MAG: PKD domain-containing protein [Bacteroidales bacterium]|nr:PKD domain-containing protein [Bacteroidales bacterium]
MKNKLRSQIVLIGLFFLFKPFLFAQPSETQFNWTHPLSFIENKGQFDGRNWQSTQIEYAVDYNGLYILFTKNGLTYRLSKFVRNPGRSRERRHEPKRLCHSELISVNWLGANSNVELIASDKIQPYYSYAINNQETGEVTNENFINGFMKLLYKNLYNNIDVEYVSYPGQGIKYNIYLHPGADASQISMKYEGFHTRYIDENVEIELTSDGKIHMKGSLGEITELSPVAFYEDNHEPVGISYSYEEGIVSFNIDDYDNTRKLIIDPWIISPVLNSSNAVWEVETDAAGNIYAIGGETPMKLNKYNSAGTLQWTYSTPWDTAGYWLGTMATDNAGITYVTAGTSPKIQKVSTTGSMLWNNSGPNASCEYWSITFNCDNTKLIVGGTYLPIAIGFDFSSAVYNINVSNGAVAGIQTFDTTNVMGIGTSPIEIRGISASRNAKYNFLTHNSVGLITQNIGSCPTNTPLYKVPLNYTLGYKCENYLPSTQNGGGLKAIISNNNFVYTHSGSQIHKRDLATGALITSVNIAGGQSSTVLLGALVVKNCGLDVDDCGNVYAGSSDRVIKFDQDLNVLAQELTGFTVYDLSVNTNGEVVAVGAVNNNSASARDGKIRSINMSCCAQYNPTCCDATICPAGPVCHNAPAFNLVANSPGGTWSGPGITSSTLGTFDPAVAGTGSHMIVYTLACGSDSTLIVVNYCATLTPCVELNGDISVSGGTAPYTWQQWIPAGTVTITDQASCVSCGYTWNALIGQCLNGMFPATSCTAAAHWQNFTTGTTITPPPSNSYPLQVMDAGNNAASITSYASLQPCSSCPTLTIIPSNQVNILCNGGTDGSFNVITSGGSGPYDYVLMQGTTAITSFNGVTGTQSFTGLGAGSYILNVLDNDSCPGSIPITITEPTAIDAGTPSVVDANCGQNNGSATVTPSGGTPIYSYEWNTTPVQTTETASNLPGGTYTVTITDANSCTVTTAVTVGNIGAPTLQTSFTDASCGQANGSATVTATGGSGTYTYLWSTTPPQTTQTATNITAGTYSVTVDDGVCPASASVTINDISIPIYDSIHSILDANCNNPVGGAIVTVTGGTPPYNYEWSTTPVQTTPNLQNVGQGTYSVTITDSQGCSTTSSVTIGGIPGPTLTMSSTNEHCDQGDGTASCVATGGSGTYTYLWSNQSTNTSISPLSAGTYSITVNDGNCDAFASVSISNVPGPTASFSYTPQIITSDNAVVTFTGTSLGNINSWAWSFGDGNSSTAGNTVIHEYGLQGTYTVVLTVTDINGCTDSDSGLIVVNEPFSIYIPNTFTPDGDGLNDGFAPIGKNIDPDNFEMYVFDRWGSIMYRTTEWLGETCKAWNGTKNNSGTEEDVVVDVYTYRIKLKSNLGHEYSYIGSVTLIK